MRSEASKVSQLGLPHEENSGLALPNWGGAIKGERAEKDGNCSAASRVLRDLGYQKRDRMTHLPHSYHA